MYDRILVPTDGSDATWPAVEQALELARQYDADLHVLSVVDTDALPLDAHTRHLVQRLEDDGRDAVLSVEDEAEGRSVPVTTLVVRGRPHVAIVEYADDNDIDLVVMGTHGRTGLDRLLLGSVTARVLRTSDVPVLVVPTAEEP